MRKAISILLIFIFFLNIMGLYISFAVKQNAVKSFMVNLAQNWQSKSVQVLLFSQQEYDQLEWVEKGEELKIKGLMYDVSRTEFCGNTIKLYVEPDNDETTLVNDFVCKMSEPQKGETESPFSRLLQHFLKEFTVSDKLQIASPSLTIAKLRIPDSDCFLDIVPALHAPPPKF